ncbi:polygalacturonase [Agrobacterium larrymoorei]|uniref:Polygalacturonase n=1 Tax=Agrobacterium larrymoorei TaxID=160699 RepID=A0AAJ2B9G2_9HYPH|nr:glycosyl hydrolase family 28 protein [Agrobacterium larrymoorei]MDR6102000.1 polygalacturonase [Agrobacterium larrymoorei]
MTKYQMHALCFTAYCLAVGLALVVTSPAYAAVSGDRRTVSEPTLSTQLCATLSPQPAAQSASAQQEWDTQRLQAAIDACPEGQAVKLSAGTAGGRFVSGPLTIRSGVTLWLDRGVVLAAVADPHAYDRGNGTCGTIDTKGQGCRPFILFEKTQRAALVGDGLIDGQGGALMAGSNETWWQLARRAQSQGGKQNNPRLIQVDDGADIVFYRVTLRNAPTFHIMLNGVKGATLWGVRIDTPADARNTDGIDPAGSQDVTIAHSFIRGGDDNIAIKGGSAPTRYVSILDSHLYWGHGLSIGSETESGVSDILVQDVTIDGATSGLRIKSDISRGGLVSAIQYENVCLRGNRNPIDFDTRYDKQAHGSDIPVYRDILLRSVKGETGTLVLRGYDATHPISATFDGVRFDPTVSWQIENATLSVGPGGITPAPPVKVSSVPKSSAPSDKAAPPNCAGRWLDFPSAN